MTNDTAPNEQAATVQNDAHDDTHTADEPSAPSRTFTVEYDGTTYDLPFQGLLHPLSDSERPDLLADIVKHGVVVPVVVGPHYQIIDGGHRLSIAAELGLPIHFDVRADLTLEEMRKLALSLNVHRRHLNPEQRKEQVEKMRAQGMSTSKIAHALKTTERTVRRDLAAASGSASAQPDQITGRDGKVYPPRRAGCGEQKERREKAAALKAEGRTRKEIAAKLGVSPASVTEYLKPSSNGATDLNPDQVEAVSNVQDVEAPCELQVGDVEATHGDAESPSDEPADEPAAADVTAQADPPVVQPDSDAGHEASRPGDIIAVPEIVDEICAVECTQDVEPVGSSASTTDESGTEGATAPATTELDLDPASQELATTLSEPATDDSKAPQLTADSDADPQPLASREANDQFSVSTEVSVVVLETLGTVDVHIGVRPQEHGDAIGNQSINCEDALESDWEGRIFVNSPINQHTGEWIDMLTSRFAAGTVTEAIVLVPAHTDAPWWASLHDHPICFLTRRPPLAGVGGEAPFPGAVFYLGPNVAQFIRGFSQLGGIWSRMAVESVSRAESVHRPLDQTVQISNSQR